MDNSKEKLNKKHTALRTRLGHIRRPRIGRAPIKRLRIWMHPKEALMPPLTHPFPNRLARILPHKLANHRLRDRVDDRGVRRLALPVGNGVDSRGVRIIDRTGRDVR